MKKILFALLSFLSLSITAQDDINFTPDQNGVTTLTCNGFIIDSGGQGGPGYGNNELITITICPDTVTTGDNSLFITVVFNVFDLDPTNLGTQQNPNIDQMLVFDGTSTNANLLGNYSVNDLQNIPIGATNLNGSGCLTFQFYSNAQGTGAFAGLATCEQPCEAPVANADIIDGDTPDSIRVCIGEPITFDATASTAAAGFTIDEYSWNFIDGTVDNTTGSVITHTYQNPGYYAVQLTITDDNNCSNLNVAPLKVYVSEYPTFVNFPADTIVCVGDQLELTGIEDFGVYDTTWTGFPGSNTIEDGCLEDELGVAQSIPVTYTEFDPSAVIGSVDDIESVCLNMEHSFMGDLVIQLTCPNGTTINLQEQGGGGTQIGVPDQADNINCETGEGAGEGWDYCWDSQATETWLEWVDANGFGQTLEEGTYEPVESFDPLVGCPLQGTWQITVFDNWLADDGQIFEFGVTFDPSFYPDIVEFDNTVGESADSSFWDLSGENIISSTPDLNTINVEFPVSGQFSYTYEVINNFGCGFDSTVVVTVVDPPVITAGPDLNVCDQPVTLQASVDGATGDCDQVAGNYVYCYETDDTIIETFCPDNPGDGTLLEMVFNGGTLGFFGNILTVYDGDNTFAPVLGAFFDGDLTGETFVATNPNGCLTFELVSGFFGGSCADGFEEAIDISISCDGGAGLVWSWSPTSGLDNPNVQNPSVFVQQATVYTVSAYIPGQEGCIATDEVLVAPDQSADPGIDNDTTLCYNNATSLLISYLDGNPAGGGTWFDNDAGQPFPSDQLSPSDYPNGANFDLTYTVSNGTCQNSSNLQINILPVTDNSCCQTNANAGPDAVACALTHQLQADIPVGIGTWSGNPDLVFSDINDPQATVTAPSPGGTYTLTWTDFNGQLCEASDVVEIVLADSLNITVVPEDAVCFGECTGTAVAIPSGGTSSNGLYSIDWSGGVSGGVSIVQDSLCIGLWKATITDNVGCVDSTFFAISQPEQMDLVTLGSPALCKDSCNARVELNSPDAVEYTYNSGMSWTSENVGYVCPDTVATVGIRNELGCILLDSLILDNPVAFEADFNINPNPTTVMNTLITFQDISRPGPIAKTTFLLGDPVFAEETARISSYKFPTDTAGEYLITLISESEFGCIDTTSKFLTINDDLLWFIPNSFSPNGDGINDIWKPIGNTVDLTSFSCKVYDRWGRTVFATTNIEEGWNGAGQSSGEFFGDTDVYTYVLEITSATTEEKFELTGFITLIR
ncbi:MAG: gliding motility-associated C-terminal domain-containing protein [Flavobacteriales bacterium]|nr:gliding motility-associated C-terminal domain-containing protein [Flavobacteriales bacterium]